MNVRFNEPSHHFCRKKTTTWVRLVTRNFNLEEKFYFIHRIEDVLVAYYRKANLKLPLQRQISWSQVYRLGVQEFRIVFHRTFFDMESKTKTLVQLFCVVLRICPVEISICVSVFEHFCQTTATMQFRSVSYGEVDKNRHFYTGLIEGY